MSKRRRRNGKRRRAVQVSLAAFCLLSACLKFGSTYTPTACNVTHSSAACLADNGPHNFKHIQILLTMQERTRCDAHFTSNLLLCKSDVEVEVSHISGSILSSRFLCVLVINRRSIPVYKTSFLRNIVKSEICRYDNCRRIMLTL